MKIGNERRGGNFLTIELVPKPEKSTTTRSLKSRKFKVSHSLMVDYLREEEESEMKEFCVLDQIYKGFVRSV